jgi:hypothetical protein
VIGNKKMLTYIAVAVILGAALALAVAVSRGDSAAAGMGDYGTQLQAAQGVAGDTSSSASDTSDAVQADPAKMHPPLDKFTSKDPFQPLGTDNTAASTGGTGSGTDTTETKAKVTINDVAYNVSKGDQVPSGDPVFTISEITSSDVTFALLSGSFSDGSSSVTVNVGESVKVTDQDSGKSYVLKVTAVGSGGAVGTTSTGSHSITVLSVNEQNGAAAVTFQVDGKTYSDVAVGGTIHTAWGDIKVLAVNTGSQTVTIIHGDQTMTLHAGQVVVK